MVFTQVRDWLQFGSLGEKGRKPVLPTPNGVHWKAEGGVGLEGRRVRLASHLLFCRLKLTCCEARVVNGCATGHGGGVLVKRGGLGTLVLSANRDGDHQAGPHFSNALTANFRQVI